MRSMPEESRLAQAAASGDGEAFALLYDRYERPIYNYCLRLLGNEHDAQDATQDAFVKVMRRLPEMGGRELDFGPYLYTTARNASYDMIEKRKRAEPVDEIADGAGLPLGDGPALDEDPVRAAMLAADRDSIRAANSRLPARQREVLALREIEGMSYEDIADLMEMNANSVAQLISRARIRLRAELRGEAAGAVAPSSPDCERALPLLARRQDGKLAEGDDRDWLDGHLAGCPTCPLAADAMAEAGVSYRAWAPVVPAAWLFRDTLAKAAEVVGADWSAIARPGRGGGDDAGSGEAGPPGGDTSRGGDSAATAGNAGIAATAEEERRRRKRGILVGMVAAALLLGGLASTVIGDEADEPEKPAPPSTVAGPSEPSETADDSGESKPNGSQGEDEKKKRKPPAKQDGSTVAEAPSTASPVAGSPAPASTTAASPPATTTSGESGTPAKPRPRSGGGETAGSGDWGDRTQPKSPTKPPVSEPPATEPPPVSEPPVEPPTNPPPADPPPQDPDPRTPGGPNDPPPPTTPCTIRVC